MTSAVLSLTPEVFAILAALIEERLGLHYSLADRELLSYKVSTRAIEAGFDSLLDYYYYLRYDPASGEEFDALIDALVVGETYFFREYDQLQALVDTVVEPLVRREVRPRIWSAACSTGEEPLTLAMMLADRGLLTHCSLIASDVSRRALERARSGRFGVRALRQLPPGGIHERWLVETDGRPMVRPGLAERIDWRRINLLNAAAVATVPMCDVIVCRNVLIYFRDQTTERVVANLTSRLTDGGVLLVGVSESLLRFGGDLICEERSGVFLYRRRAER
jgi:chemotaxis protein methyltransferase CheR